jgi:hypothetical protein
LKTNILTSKIEHIFKEMFFRVALIFCLIYLSSSSLQIKQNIEKAMAQLTSDKLPLTLKDYLASKDDK